MDDLDTQILCLGSRCLQGALASRRRFARMAHACWSLIPTLICFSLSPPLQASESAPRFQWVQRPDSNGGSDYGYGLTVDSSGQAYQTGVVGPGASLGGATFTNGGLFVAKYSPSGQLLWAANDARQLNLYYMDDPTGWSIGLDASTNVYVICRLASQQAVFGGQILTNRGNNSLLLVKHSAAGVFLWAKPLCWGDTLVPYGLAVDPTGNCLFGGVSETGTIQTDVTNVSGNGFAAKCDPAGNIIWVAALETPYYTIDTAPTVTGEVYVLGDSGPSHRILLAKFASDGQLLWKRQPSSTNSLYAGCVAVDSKGNAFITGNCYSDTLFGDLALTNVGSANYAFLAKYDTNGNALWVRSLGTNLSPAMPCADADGNSYCLLQFSDTSRLFSKFDPAGHLLWSKSIPPSLDGVGFYAHQLAADPVGNCFFSGTLYSTVLFDDQELGTIAQWPNIAIDILVGKLDTSTPPPLTLLREPGSVQLTWPALAAGFHLESTLDLTAPNSWSSNSITPTTLDLTNLVTVPMDAYQKFFRLKRP
jgi:hypothetical protein